MDDPVRSGSPSPQALGGGEIPWRVHLRYWAVVAAWMALISYFSTDAFSASNTNRYLDPLVRWLFPDISNAGLRTAHTIIRKTAHFAEFLVLGLLVVWAQRAGRPTSWLPRWMVRALILVAAWASLDELHQAFTTSRTPSFADTGVDVLGGIAGQALLYLRHRLRSRG